MIILIFFILYKINTYFYIDSYIIIIYNLSSLFMSFERYHSSKSNFESDNNHYNHNGNNHVRFKYAPIKIIPNNVGDNEGKRKYPSLNLRF